LTCCCSIGTTGSVHKGYGAGRCTQNKCKTLANKESRILGGRSFCNQARLSSMVIDEEDSVWKKSFEDSLRLTCRNQHAFFFFML
jgi:hypothetical protein